MNSDQKLAADFVERNNLGAKAYLESTRYGSNAFQLSDGWGEELGDLYFVLLTLAWGTNVDLSAALKSALRKYHDRIVQTGKPGSGV